MDKILFTLKNENHIFLVQVYVDDNLFGSTSPDSVTSFEKLMASEFEMSIIEELTFFLGLSGSLRKRWYSSPPKEIFE